MKVSSKTTLHLNSEMMKSWLQKTRSLRNQEKFRLDYRKKF